MSDDRLRELERRWRETGALGDRAAYLQERARCGDLEPERLRLAAFLGAEVGGAEPEPPPVAEDLDLAAWIGALAAYGVVTLRRAAIAAADHSARQASSSGMPMRAVLAAEELLLCPCDSHRAEARRHAAATRDLPDAPMRMSSDLAGAAEQAALAALSEDAREVLAAARSAARAGRVALSSFPALFGDPKQEAASGLRAAITRELLPWALDEGDPVRERVERRGGLR